MSTIGGIHIQGDATIGRALSNNNLAVPMNQRSYAWKKTHVTEIFQDFANAIVNDEPEYFLGSIVVTQKGQSGRPEVVDGQQRLATSLILLAAIRDYFYNNDDPGRAASIENEFLIVCNLRTQEELPRLQLNAMDHDYFTKRVLLKPKTPERMAIKPNRDSHERIDTAAKLAAKHVQSIVAPYSPQEQTNRLIDWVDFVKERARVIWVTVPDDTNAYVMFETLNDRGLELSKADLLKNYLFGRSQDRSPETQQRWFSMMGALETVGNEDIVVTYIRHLWSSMHGPTRERELYVDIKDKVKSKQAVIDLAIDLADNANIYAALLNPDHAIWNEYGPKARKHIATLHLLRMEQMRPLLLSLVKHLTPAEVCKCLRLLVCCSVRFLIVGGLGSGTLEKHYAESAREVRSGKIKTAKDLLQAMTDVTPSDPQFESHFETAAVSKSYLARYYLRALELQAKGEPEPELVPNTDEEAINLEHVLPQSPPPTWGIDPDTIRTYARRIGNLVLLQLGSNSSISNEAFSVKQPTLPSSTN